MDKVLREVLEFCNHSISLSVEAGRAAAGLVARGPSLEDMPWAVSVLSEAYVASVFSVFI